MTASKPLTPSWPVVEIFGPTVQGEGVDQGVPCHFIRLGGCDYKCVWCDTPHAVLPEEVRKAPRLAAPDILSRLTLLSKDRAAVPWVIISGGNPALHDLTELVEVLHEDGYLVAVETQGSRWRDWFLLVDRVCVSPKPPSAEQDNGIAELDRFLHEGLEAREDEDKRYEWLFLKVVIFNEEDLDYAEKVRSQFSNALLYLSAGNDAGKTVGNPDRLDTRSEPEIKLQLLDQSEWLVQQVFKRPALCAQDVIIQSQYHVLLWGNRQGV